MACCGLYNNNVVVRRAHLAPSQWPPSNATDKKVRHTQRPIPPLLHRSSGLPLPTLLLGNIPDSVHPETSGLLGAYQVLR